MRKLCQTEMYFVLLESKKYIFKSELNIRFPADKVSKLSLISQKMWFHKIIDLKKNIATFSLQSANYPTSNLVHRGADRAEPTLQRSSNISQVGKDMISSVG